MDVFHSYDAFGNVTNTAYKPYYFNGRTYRVQSEFLAPEGRPVDHTTYTMPNGAAQETETVQYIYDSALNLDQITIDSGLGPEILYDVTARDDFGRVTGASYGNGVTADAVYRTDFRRELREKTIRSLGGVRRDSRRERRDLVLASSVNTRRVVDEIAYHDGIAPSGLDGEGKLAYRKHRTTGAPTGNPTIEC